MNWLIADISLTFRSRCTEIVVNNQEVFTNISKVIIVDGGWRRKNLKLINEDLTLLSSREVRLLGNLKFIKLMHECKGLTFMVSFRSLSVEELTAEVMLN